MGELPAFLHFLVTWQIPEALRDGRFGIKTWHHPQLLADLDALAPETRLLALIDQELFSEGEIGNGIQVATSRKDWQGTAEQLEQVLFGSDFRVEAQRTTHLPDSDWHILGAARQQTARSR